MVVSRRSHVWYLVEGEPSAPIERDVTIDIPEKIEQHAYLRYKAAEQSGYDGDFEEYLWDYVLLDAEFVDSNGNPLDPDDCD